MEESREEVHLDDGGVLELVEENAAMLGADLGDRFLRFGDDPRRQGELIGEVEDSGLALAPVEFGDRIEEGNPLSVRMPRLPDVLVLRPRLFERRVEFFEREPRAREVIAVLGELTRQVERFRDRSRNREFRIECAGPCREDVGHHLDGACLAEHPEVGVDADPQSVLSDDPLREGVVGEGDGIVARVEGSESV